MGQQENNISAEDKVFAAMSYIWALVLLSYLIKKKNAYCQFHIRQGLVLFIGSFGVMVLGMFPFLGVVILFFGWLAIVVLAFLGVMSALQGRQWEMTFIGKYAKEIHL